MGHYTAPNGPGYTGHVNDPDVGLVYMQQRYYDPEMGRFLSVDSVEIDPGNFFAFNRYAYARNSPARFVDRDGRNPGDLFKTPEMAALDALRFINGKSISTNHEYTGYIVISGTKFVATDPVPVTETGGNRPGDVPKGSVGDYHTHGNYSIQTGPQTIVATGDPNKDNLNSDNFSPQDIKRYTAIKAILGAYRGYLGTPSGKYYVFYNGNKGDLEQIVRQQEKQQEEQQEEKMKQQQNQ